MQNQISKLNIKSLNEDGMFIGYASVFDVIDFQNDQVMPGAFTQSLKNYKEQNTWPKMLWQHDHNHPIGVWLDMTEDSKGLLVKGRLLLEVSKGREAYALLKNGVTNGLSIGFSLEEASTSKQGHQLLHKLNLHEVSLVTYAANPMAKVEWVKSFSIEQRLTKVIEKLSYILRGV